VKADLQCVLTHCLKTAKETEMKSN